MASKRNTPRRSTSCTPSMLLVLVGTVRAVTLFLIDLLLTLVRAGSVGYITPELIKQNIAPPGLDNKVKVFVCGE